MISQNSFVHTRCIHLTRRKRVVMKKGSFHLTFMFQLEYLLIFRLTPSSPFLWLTYSTNSQYLDKHSLPSITSTFSNPFRSSYDLHPCNLHLSGHSLYIHESPELRPSTLYPVLRQSTRKE